MLRMTVRKIGLPWCPNDVKLFHTVPQPPALAIASLAASLLDGILNKTLGCDVVSFDPCRWLWVFECIETVSQGDQFMGVHVKG